MINTGVPTSVPMTHLSDWRPVCRRNFDIDRSQFFSLRPFQLPLEELERAYAVDGVRSIKELSLSGTLSLVALKPLTHWAPTHRSAPLNHATRLPL